MTDTVSHPGHYIRGGIEAIDVIQAWGLNFCMGNAVKYLCRAGYKHDALEDLEKARQYIEFEIEQRKREMEPHDD